MVRVAPFQAIRPFFLRAPISRVMLFREVPSNCAISSCVNAQATWTPSFAAMPFVPPLQDEAGKPLGDAVKEIERPNRVLAISQVSRSPQSGSDDPFLGNWNFRADNRACVRSETQNLRGGERTRAQLTRTDRSTPPSTHAVIADHYWE
jgi:hypothetical protein